MRPDELRPLVRELLASMISSEATPARASTTVPSAAHQAPAARGRGPEVISAAQVTAARSAGRLAVSAGAIVTPLARDAAERFGVTLIHEGGGARSPAVATGPSPSQHERFEAPHSPSPERSGGPIAVGSDHGGFRLKTRLIRHLRERRIEVLDCGTYEAEACDYPDYALAVGRSVSMGEAAWGLLIDGAGIGSCMAANKVPGVLAANCHSPATARNSREHNSANVLCLGCGHMDEGGAIDILDAWLATAFGGGRHGRRVAKIRAIEQSFLGGGA